MKAIDDEFSSVLDVVAIELSALEWSAWDDVQGDSCPRCHKSKKDGHRVNPWTNWQGTHPPCTLDLALVAAGYPSQASRDEARAEHAKGQQI